MKQGHASRSGMTSTKVEPVTHVVNVTKVSRLGNHVGNHTTDDGRIDIKSQPLYQGRGFEAPKTDDTHHHRGSQGKHR